MLWWTSCGSLPLFPPEVWGFFLWHSLWGCGRLSAGKNHRSVRTLDDGVPRRSFHCSGLSTLSLQQFINYSSGCLHPALVPTAVLLWDVEFLWIRLSLHQFLGQPFALWPYFYWSSKKSCWVFSLFSFFFYFFLGWIGGFPGGARGKEPTGQCRGHKRHGFDPWVGKIPWRKAWQHCLVFLFR